MHRYKIRVHKLSALGFLTQADHYDDHYLDSPDSLREVAAQLAANGFLDPERNRWIMPGSIAWIEPA